MKTTDVYVEQVLMGLLVLVTAGFFYFDHRPEVPGFVGGTLLLGSSYLLGILYDRLADTLLQNFEQHSRLEIAIKRLKTSSVAPDEDPFPEQKLRISILESQGVAKYSDYLRSRIRLTRALATILPALCVAITIFLLGHRNGQSSLPLWSGIAVASVYGCVLILNLLELPVKLPKTKKRAEFDAYMAAKETDKKWHPATEPSVIGAVVLFGLLAYIASTSDRKHLMFMVPVAVIATLFAGWTWYRINMTQLTLFSDYGEHKKSDQKGTDHKEPEKNITASQVASSKRAGVS